MTKANLAMSFVYEPPPIFVATHQKWPVPVANNPMWLDAPAKGSPGDLNVEPIQLGPLVVPTPPPLVFPSQSSVVQANVQPSLNTPTVSKSPTLPTQTEGGTVRRGDKNEYVSKLQSLLNSAGARPPLPLDGSFGPRTETALRAFQSSHGLSPDGVAGPRTWKALMGIKAGPTQPTPTNLSTPNEVRETDEHPASTLPGEFCFPLAFKPSPDWHSGARYFGARRDGGNRRHGGCDLLGPKGTQIYAIADGKLVRPAYNFYSGTHAVEIRHGKYIVRYGEILPGSYTGGSTVKKGQPICKIGRLNSGSSMLHFEMYANGSSTAPLTVKSGPFRRRSDLIDPTPFLDEWAKHLPR